MCVRYQNDGFVDEMIRPQSPDGNGGRRWLESEWGCGQTVWMEWLDGYQTECGCGVGVGSDEECSLMDSPGVVCSGPERRVCVSV